MVTEGTAWVRSNLTAPIKLSGEAIGFLSLSSGEPDAFPAALFEPVVDLVRAVGMPLVPMSEVGGETRFLDTIMGAYRGRPGRHV